MANTPACVFCAFARRHMHPLYEWTCTRVSAPWFLFLFITLIVQIKQTHAEMLLLCSHLCCAVVHASKQSSSLLYIQYSLHLCSFASVFFCSGYASPSQHILNGKRRKRGGGGLLLWGGKLKMKKESSSPEHLPKYAQAQNEQLEPSVGVTCPVMTRTWLIWSEWSDTVVDGTNYISIMNAYVIL